jgi:hypothetical protein
MKQSHLQSGFILTATIVPAQVGGAQVALRLCPLSEMTEPGRTDTGAAAGLISDWLRDFLARPHPALGREGHVCPFSAHAARIDTVRIGVNDAAAGDVVGVLKAMASALAAFDAMPCPRGAGRFRTVLIGFPLCLGEEGFATLKNAQRRLVHHSILKGKMIAACHELSDDSGLINAAFRPLRSPVPLLAIREMVDGDAPFVLRNRKMAPIYLVKFRLRGAMKLFTAWRNAA